MAVVWRFLDVLFILLAMRFSLWAHAVPMNDDYLYLSSLAALMFLFFGEMFGLYRSWLADKLNNELASLGSTWFSVVAALVSLGFATKTSSDYSRFSMVMWASLVPLLMLIERISYRKYLLYRGLNSTSIRKLAFYGCSNVTHRMAEHINERPWMGLRVLGVYDDRLHSRIDLRNLTFAGNMQNLIDGAHSGEIDIVYVTLPMHAEQLIIRLINKLSDTTASVYVVPDSLVFDVFKTKWATVGGIPVVKVHESPFHGIDGVVKRLEDVILGTLILLLIFPLMLLIALGIKLTSRGAVLFKQRRYGLSGEIVEVWKFRSMTVCDDGPVVIQAKKNDARITRFGAFLRRTSMDELPQFINVLQGHMSIVGPRPHAVAHNELYRSLVEGYMLRHKVKPGITGWAQINGWRGETDSLEKMQGRVDCDLAYVRNWTLGLDLKIIFLTVFKVFWGNNAY